MRRATNFHRTLHEFNELRAVDLVALALGYGLILALFTLALASFFDWLEGRPAEAVEQVRTVLGWISWRAR